MKSLSAPCDKSGFFPFLFAPRGLVSSLRLSAPLVFSSPPLGEITERESRLRKAFFRSLLVLSCMISRNKGLIARLGLLGPFVQREPDCRYIHGENEHIGENYCGTATMRRRQASPLLLPLVRCFTGPLDPLTLHESTAYMSVIPTEVEGSRPVLGVHARISARPRQPGEARGSRLRAVDGARSLHFGRDDRI